MRSFQAEAKLIKAMCRTKQKASQKMSCKCRETYMWPVKREATTKATRIRTAGGDGTGKWANLGAIGVKFRVSRMLWPLLHVANPRNRKTSDSNC